MRLFLVFIMVSMLCGCGKKNDAFLQNSIEQDYLKLIELDDTEIIESSDWLDDKKTIMRIGIKYREIPDDLWFNHKMDYLIYPSENELCVESITYSTDLDEREVWMNPTFSFHLEDVNFDNKEDIIISLGMDGLSGLDKYCAYLYKDNKYVYCPSFEEISCYHVDEEEKCIISKSCEYVSKFYYENDVFVERDFSFIK